MVFATIRLPFNFWTKSRKSVLLLVLIGGFRIVLTILVFYQIKTLVTELQDSTTINQLSVVKITLLLALNTFVRMKERVTAERMGQSYINQIRSILIKRMMRTSIREIHRLPVGYISALLSGDLNSLKKWISMGLSRLIVNMVVTLGLIGFIVTINPWLALNISVVISLMMFWSVKVGGGLSKSMNKSRSAKIKLSGLVVERISQIQTIRSSGQELNEVLKINKQSKKVMNSVIPVASTLGLIRGISDVIAPALIVTLLISSTLLSNGMPQTISLIALLGFLSAPIKELSRLQNYYQGAKLSLRKINKFYQYKRIVRGKSTQNNFTNRKGRILISQLNFSDCIQNLSLSIHFQDKYWIKGPNGSGKSTLIALILGQLKPDSGKIRINGSNPLKYAPSLKAKVFGVYRFGEGLMRGTIRENICYRNNKASLASIQSVIKKCQLEPLIKSLDHGLDSTIQELGRNISSGQIGRILLARAILDEPEILVLDEPESSLDASGLQLLKKIISDYKFTVLLISHNDEIASVCDNCLDLKHTQATSLTQLKEQHSYE